MNAFNLAIYASVGFKEKEDVYKHSFELYKQLRLKEESTHEQLSRESLVKIQKHLKPASHQVHQRSDCWNLIRWYCSEFEKITLPERKKETFSVYMRNKIALIGYFSSSYQDLLQGVRKDFCEASRLITRDTFQTIDEITGFLEVFVKKMERKREKDNVDIMERMQVQVNSQQAKIRSLESVIAQKTQDVEAQRELVHILRTKLSSNYFLIYELNRDLDYFRDYGRIMDGENKRLANALKQLDEETIKGNDKQNEQIKKLIREYEKGLQLILKERQEMEQRRKEETEIFTNKQKYDLMRILEDQVGAYQDFRTYNKQTQTNDLNAAFQVSLSFPAVPSKIRKVHRRIQTIDMKQDAQVQCDMFGGSFRSKMQSEAVLSEEANRLHRNMTISFNVGPNMKEREGFEGGQSERVPSNQRNNKMNRQMSLIMNEEDGLGEGEKGNPKSRMGMFEGEERSISEELRSRFQSKDKLSVSMRSQINEGDQFTYGKLRDDHSEEKNSLDGSMSREGTTKYKGQNTLSPDRNVSKHVSRKSRNQGESSIFHPSLRSVNRSLTTKALEALEKGGNVYENMRETQLRNELIKNKQLLHSLNNKLNTVTSRDTSKAIAIQTNIQDVNNEIEVIETQIKTNKKNSDQGISKQASMKPTVTVSTTSSVRLLQSRARTRTFRSSGPSRRETT